MMKQRNPVLTLLLLAALAAPVTGVADESDDAAQLEAIIEAIEQGWENADGAPFYAHFLGQDGARFIESGGQNEGLQDLVEHRRRCAGRIGSYL